MNAVLVNPSPELPVQFGVVWLVLVAAYLTLAIAAVFSLWRSRGRLTQGEAMVWGAAVVLVPAIGSIAWFLIGRPKTKRRATAQRNPG